MKRILPFFLASVLLASCNGWIIQPLPGNPPTPFLPFTQTPSVLSPTPVIIGVFTASPTPSIASLTPSTTPFPTMTGSAAPVTSTATNTSTPPPATLGLAIKVLSCNTSADFNHGMGEVTNAFILLKNTGGIQLSNIKTTLNVLDPGLQIHPDQTIATTVLPVGYQVTLKLTADTTTNSPTPIQVKVTSDQGEFPIEGLPSCVKIGFGSPDPAGLNTPIPATP